MTGPARQPPGARVSKTTALRHKPNGLRRDEAILNRWTTSTNYGSPGRSPDRRWTPLKIRARSRFSCYPLPSTHHRDLDEVAFQVTALPNRRLLASERVAKFRMHPFAHRRQVCRASSATVSLMDVRRESSRVCFLDDGTPVRLERVDVALVRLDELFQTRREQSHAFEVLL